MELQTGATGGAAETGRSDPRPGDRGSDAGSDDPRSDRRRQAIIRAATEVFLRHGYLGATTDEVAARASVSKQTIYKQFGDKQRLFAAMILETTVQVVDGLSIAVASTLEDTEDVRRALRDLAEGIQRGLLQPDVLRLRRLVIAEADRFPEAAGAWFDRGFDRTMVILGEAMQRLADRGLLRNLSDPTLAAYQFAGLVMYQPMNQVMFAGTDALPRDDQLDRIAESAVEMFLASYGSARPTRATGATGAVQSTGSRRPAARAKRDDRADQR